MYKQPPKQPTVPLMPRTISPNNIIRLDNTPLILDNRVIGVCKKKDTGCVECIIWDRNITYEYMLDKNNAVNSVVINVNKEKPNEGKSN